MDLSNLSDDLKAKARECKTTEELLALASEEGVELSDAELENVSGGYDWKPCTSDCNEVCNYHGCGSYC